MKYPEYLKTAERHLATCQKFFDSMDWTEAPQWDIFNNWQKKQRIYKKECDRLPRKKESLKSFTEKAIDFEKLLKKQNDWLDQRKHRLEIFDTLLKQIENVWLVKKKKSLKYFTEKKIDCANFLHKQNKWLDQRKRRLEIFDTLLKQLEEYLPSLKSSLEQKRNLLKDLDHLLLEDHLLKDLFYLSGYILEAFTVYLVYRRGGFSPQKDIENLDIKFSRKTHVDYNKTKREKKGSVRYQKDYDSEFNKKLDELNQLIKESDYFYSIEGHNFSQIICFVLRSPKFDLIKPSENIPLFNHKENPKIEIMIRKWKTKLRYSSEDNYKTWKDLKLTPNSLKELIDLCEKIKNHPCCKL